MEGQLELQDQFGDDEFGSLAQCKMEGFLKQEEDACLKENPFFQEDECAEASDTSILSGVSDKSIMLKQSNLCADENVFIPNKLKLDRVTKLSRCDYFRHNSSRLGSLEDSKPEFERPDLGFVHRIRSPDRRPFALLPEIDSPCVPSLSSTYRIPEKDLAGIEKADDQVNNTKSVEHSLSEPNSANSTYIQSGNSTKTVVSLTDPGTLQAAELANRLQTLADQMDSDLSHEASEAPCAQELKYGADDFNSPKERTDRESLICSNEIDISTISKILSEASISDDSQHLVNALLESLKKKDAQNSDEKKKANFEDKQMTDSKELSNKEKLQEENKNVKNVKKTNDTDSPYSNSLPIEREFNFAQNA